MDHPAIPHDAIEVGSALFTLVEPHRGREAAYNRWYERDHFYAGCLIGPMWFAGERWVATKALKDLRYPAETPFLPDPTAGSYLATYWILKGHEADAIAWGSAQVHWLHANDRMYAARDHVHTLMYTYRWSAWPEGVDDGVPAALALDHPYGGLVVLMVDRAGGTEPRQVSAWLQDALPGLMAGTPWSLTCALTPIPLPEGAPVTQPANEGQDRRTLLMAFTDGHPGEAWDTFAGLGEAIAASGLATLSWAAPFVPTIAGTDTYTDQLWD